jgi:single-stranded DNA-binding protein
LDTDGGKTMMRLLCSGTLHGSPQTRTSAKGTGFTTARLRADDGKGASVWCSLIAFGEIGEQLGELKDKAAIAVAGRVTPKAWLDKDGEAQGGLDLVVDQLATLKGKPKPKADHRQPRQPPHRGAPVHDGVPFDDDLESIK